MNGDAAAMNGHAIDVTIVPYDDGMVEAAVNLPVVIEIGDSVWLSEALQLFSGLKGDVWNVFQC